MIFKAFLYAIYTVLSAYVESIRIKIGWGKNKNVIHFISGLIGIAGFLAIIFIFHVKSPIDLIFYTLICLLIRGILYDPFLNLFRKKEIDYTSPTSTSIIDKKESIFKWGFWKQRRIYLYSFIFMIILYYIIHFCLEKIF